MVTWRPSSTRRNRMNFAAFMLFTLLALFTIAKSPTK